MRRFARVIGVAAVLWVAWVWFWVIRTAVEKAAGIVWK